MKNTKIGDLDFVAAYGGLVRLVGREEADIIMQIAAGLDCSMEEKMEYLKDTAWSIKYARVQAAAATQQYLN